MLKPQLIAGHIRVKPQQVTVACGRIGLGEGVRARSPLKQVSVIAHTTLQTIVAQTTAQSVITGIGQQLIRQIIACQTVIGRTTVNAFKVENGVGACTRDLSGCEAEVNRQTHRRDVTVIHIVAARKPIHEVIAQPTSDRVTQCIARQAVIAQSAEHVLYIHKGVCTPSARVLSCGGGKVNRHCKACTSVICPVAANPTIKGIRAQTAFQYVATITTTDAVIA